MQNQDYHKITFNITWISGIWVLIVYLKFLEGEGNTKTTTHQSLQHAHCFNWKKKKSISSSKSPLNQYYLCVWKHQEQNIKLSKHPILSQPDKYACNKFIFCLQDCHKLERKSLHADGISLISEKYIIGKFIASPMFHTPGQSLASHSCNTLLQASDKLYEAYEKVVTALTNSFVFPCKTNLLEGLEQFTLCSHHLTRSKDEQVL